MKLEDYRKQLDKIDEQLALLFEKRMEVIENVRIYKSKHNLPVLDQKREDAMHVKNAEIIRNKDFVACHSRFLSSILAISKEYMIEKNATEEQTLKVAKQKDNHIKNNEKKFLQNDKKKDD